MRREMDSKYTDSLIVSGICSRDVRSKSRGYYKMIHNG